MNGYSGACLAAKGELSCKVRKTGSSSWAYNTYVITGDLKGSLDSEDLVATPTVNTSIMYMSISYAETYTFTPTYNSANYNSIGLNMGTPSRVGYTFTGWTENSIYVSDNNNDQLFDFYPTAMSYSTSVTFTANWTANTYSISYSLAGGTAGTYAPTSATFGPAGGTWDVSISNPTRVGYTFTGWSISGMSTNCTHWWGGVEQGSAATATGVKATTGFLNLRSASGTVTFTATWSANTYTIKVTNITGSISVTKNTGSTSPTSVTLNNNGTTSLSYAPTGGTYDASISNPAKTGYTFTGWDISNMSTDCTHCWGGKYRGSNATATGITETAGFLNLRSTSGTVTFTAQWTANTYSIKYALGGGVQVSGKEYPVSATYDIQFKVDEPIRTGYTFTGWTLSNCGTVATHYYGSSSASTSFTTATLTNKKGPYFKNLRATSGEVTFTAVWSANSYTIAFAMNNPNSVTTDINGNFRCELQLYLDKNLSVQAIVTSPTGETHEQSSYLPLYKHYIVADIPQYIHSGTAPDIKIFNVYFNEVNIPYNVDVIDINTQKHYTPNTKWSNIPSGEYSIKISAHDAETYKINNIIVYNKKDKLPPIQTALFVPKNEYYNNEQILIGTSFTDSHILYTLWSHNTILEQKWLTPKLGNFNFKVTLPDSINNATVTLLTARNYKFYTRRK